MPLAGANTDIVKCCPCGPPWEEILASTTMLISRISAIVHASLSSITSAPRRAGITVSAVANVSNTSVTAKGTHCGGFATPIAFSSELKKTAAP